MAGVTVVEIIAVASAIGSIAAVIIAGLTSRAAARKEDLTGLQSTVKTLQDENKRLVDKITRLEIVLEEREKRISVLETNLRDVTQSRIERIQYIRELEGQVEDLQARLKNLEKDKPK